MKNIKIVVLTLLLITISATFATAKTDGVTIQDGTLLYSAGSYLAGQAIPVGYDAYGYNYQAHMFSGYYVNVYLNRYGYPPYDPANEDAYLIENPTVTTNPSISWAWPYRSINVIMKWNNAWMSNMDRDGDGKLDRHYGYPSYIGSGAWETNHQSGDNTDGSKWTYFTKIIAVPSDARVVGRVPGFEGTWYTANGVEIGPSIWGEFATIQEVYNDPSTGDHGILYKSPGPAGLGHYQH